MKKNFILLAICSILFSCDNFLDVIPKGKVIPETTDDFDGMMADPLISRNSFYLVDISGDNVLIDDVNVNNYLLQAIGKAYFWLDSFYNEQESDYAWSYAYNNIYKCNIVIKLTPNSKGGIEADKKRVIAEAKVNRAYYYWFLYNTYSKAYDKSTASSDLGVPIVTEPDLEAKPKRATVQDVVNFILDDLKGVEKDLPVTGKNTYRVSRVSAYALLARVYYYIGEYDKAAEQAKKALELNSSLVDLKTWSFVNANFPSRGITNKPLATASPENMLYRYTSFQTVISSFKISPELENLYKIYPNDLRLKFNFTNIQRNGKPFEDGEKRYLHDLDHTIGVPEMMLIEAEGLARNGDSRALEILNNLRKYRFLDSDFVPMTGSGKEELLKLVIEERQRELPYNGLRWFDIKRNAKEGLFTKTLTRNMKGEIRTLEPNSNRYVFPIASKIISINPAITQNPR